MVKSNSICICEMLPNKTCALASIASTLSDSSTLVCRMTLDFIIIFIEFVPNVFSEYEWICLLRSLLPLLEGTDYGIKRRILKLLFTTEVEEGEEPKPLEKELIMLN